MRRYVDLNKRNRAGEVFINGGWVIWSAALAFVWCLGLGPAISACGNDSLERPITAVFKGSPITLKWSQNYGGAVYSLTWMGKEFINASDKGRELQSAVSFMNKGECLNPTEAGSRDDRLGSSSVLLCSSTTSNSLTTKVQMAYWLSPGERSSACGARKQVEALNTARVSEDVLTKTITVGSFGLSNVIEHRASFDVVERNVFGLFEVLTAYLPEEFSSLWTVDLSGGPVSTRGQSRGEQGLPLIASTADQRYALALFSPDLPQKGLSTVGYGGWRFLYSSRANSTTKLNVVYRISSLQTTSHDFVSYIIIGSMADVQRSITQLYQATKNHR
jgi:hypothetical protein